MATVKITLNYEYNSEQCYNTWHFWNYSVGANLTIINALLDAFHDDIFGFIQDAMVSDVNFQKLTGWAFDYPVGVDYNLVGQTGSISATNAQEMPVENVANVRRYVGATVDPVTSAPYTGLRPIRRGRLYFSGLPKSLIAGSGVNSAATEYAAFSALLTGVQLDLASSPGVIWQNVVLGLPLAALPPSPTYPTGKPARDYVVAPVTGIQFIEWTKLESRDG